MAARGEAYTGHVNRSDFVAALSVLARKLALDVDEPQIEQLFDAVAARGDTQLSTLACTPSPRATNKLTAA